MAPRTEQDVLALLRTRYTEKSGNGDAWAFVTHVRNAAGFGASRTADAIAMALWPSRGLKLHGFEVKVSRGDWLRELKDPAKAEVFCQLVDYWWLAVGDDSIVQPGELPERWGLLVAKGGRLVCKTEAKPLHDETRPVDRGFVACLLRSACRVAEAGPAEVQEAVEAERARLGELHRQSYDALEGRLDELRERIRAFQQAAGVSISGWHGERPPEEVGAALRLVLRGEQDVAAIERRLEYLAESARGVAEDVEARLAREAAA